jgi:hypothetical protein
MSEQKEKESNVCSICLEELKQDSSIYTMVLCKHSFHDHCIQGWVVKDNKTCPNCRNRIQTRELQTIRSLSCPNTINMIVDIPVQNPPPPSVRPVSFGQCVSTGVTFAILLMICIIIGFKRIAPSLNYTNSDILTSCFILGKESAHTPYCLPRICSCAECPIHPNTLLCSNLEATHAYGNNDCCGDSMCCKYDWVPHSVCNISRPCEYFYECIDRVSFSACSVECGTRNQYNMTYRFATQESTIYTFSKLSLLCSEQNETICFDFMSKYKIGSTYDCWYSSQSDGASFVESSQKQDTEGIILLLIMAFATLVSFWVWVMSLYKFILFRRNEPRHHVVAN